MFIICETSGTDTAITQTVAPADGPAYRAMLEKQQATFIEVARSWIDPWSYYVSAAGELRERTPMGATVAASTVVADGVDTLTVRDVPAGATIRLDGAPQGTADGSALELTFEAPATYTILLEHVRHMSQEITVEAVAP